MRGVQASSLGDSINWEWIVQCAIDSGKDIVIVSRDGDFGATYKDATFLNDWLFQEFKQRVSQKRKIILTHKLSEGLKIVHASVTQEMEEAEKDLIRLTSKVEKLSDCDDFDDDI